MPRFIIMRFFIIRRFIMRFFIIIRSPCIMRTWVTPVSDCRPLT